eukprot:TRINITY_DN3433_c0_g1_i1.p1 TRINITY_DN3433_c0_g1~~TRINITY_DN3433_c0_g1_i1.p1  ORF type:complete len:192 (+),score=48.27 TRINITY_DN3433_c0_g1_i1:226-801(+)
MVFNVLSFFGNLWTLIWTSISIMVECYAISSPNGCLLSSLGTAGTSVLIVGQIFMFAAMVQENKRIRRRWNQPTTNVNTVIYRPVSLQTSPPPYPIVINESTRLIAPSPPKITPPSYSSDLPSAPPHFDGWSPILVAEWMRSIKTSTDYSDVVMHNQITGRVLGIMTADRWQRLGFANGDIFLIEDALRRL